MMLSTLNLKYLRPVAMHTPRFSPWRFKRKYKNMDSNKIGKNDNQKNYCEVSIADYHNAVWSYKLPCEKVSSVLSSASV